VELFSRNYNCGGGVARQGEICGALTGALLALGEIEGKAMASDPVAGRDVLYARARELTEAFRTAHGAILCRELTGCALDTEAGQRAFKERGLHQNLCTKLVSFAAEHVGTMGISSKQ
jgi:C_GCAxxG_C_C family probable redox protein